MNMITDYLMGNIPQLITALFGVSAVWIILSKSMKVLKEITELLNAIVLALSDKKLTKEEIETIIKEAKDVGSVVSGLFNKKKTV